MVIICLFQAWLMGLVNAGMNWFLEGVNSPISNHCKLSLEAVWELFVPRRKEITI